MAPVKAAAPATAADEWMPTEQADDSSDWVVSDQATEGRGLIAQAAWDRLHDPHNDLLHNSIAYHANRTVDLTKKTGKVTPPAMAPDDGGGGFMDRLGGFAEQTGITPAAVWEPVTSGIKDVKEGRYGDAAVDAARAFVPGFRPLHAVGQGLLRDPYEEFQTAQSMAEKSGVTPPEVNEAGDITSLPSMDTIKAGGHLAAAAVPIFGHQAAEIGESFGKGNDARAQGRAAGLLLPLIAGGAMGKGEGKGVTPDSPPPSEGVLPTVRRTTAEHTGSKAAELTEHMLEHSAPGSMVFRSFRRGAVEDVHRLADATVAKITQYKGTPEELGTHVQQAIEEGRRQAGAAATRLRGEVDMEATPRRYIKKETTVANETVDSGVLDANGNPITHTRPKTTTTSRIVADDQTGTWVDYSSLKQYVPEIKAIVDDPYRVIPDADRAALKKLATQIEKGLGTMKTASRSIPWDTAVRDRQVLARYLKPDADLLAGERPLQDIRGSLHTALDGAMEEALTKYHGAEVADKWRSAEALARANKETYITSVVGKLAGKAPETVPDVLRAKGTGLEEVRAIKQHVGPEMFDAMVGKVMNDMIGESMDSVRGKADVRYLNPQKLAQKIETLSRNGKLSELVTPEIEADLANLVREARATKLPRGIDISMLNSPINAGLGLKAVLKKGLTSVGGAATGLATVGGTIGLSWLLTHPEGIAQLRQAIAEARPPAGTGAVVAGTMASEGEERRRQQPAQAPRPTKGVTPR